MAKSPFEKQIESQMRQAKQLADKQRREADKRAREQKRMEQKAAVREQASSIVNGQPLVEGFRIMDKTAFEDKQAALDKQDRREKERQQSIVNYGNLVFGNVTGSTLTVDNSIHQIEQDIDEKGGEDKEELHELLDEVKELIENIQSSRAIPKQRKLFEKISNHIQKHG